MASSEPLVDGRWREREWRLSVVFLALAIGCSFAAAVIVVSAPADPGRASIGTGEGLALAWAWAAFPVVGTIIIRSRPGNVIGWLCVLGGLHNGIVAVVTAIATTYLTTDPGSSTGILFGWLSHTLVTSLFIVPVLIMLRFPTGKPLGPGWRAAERVSIAVIVMVVLLFAVEPMPLFSFPATPNPLAVGSPRLTALGPGLIYLWSIPVGAGTAALFARYRLGSLMERRQIRWLAMASCIVALAAGTMPLTSPDMTDGRMSTVSAFAFALAFWTIPISIGIAIVRHQLYDIDRVIKRTLVYAVVSGVLALAYGVTVVGLSTPLTTLLPATGETVTTAAATLIVAGLFRPVRSRSQAAVDRRFDRERHEAKGIVEAFSGSIREEIDLGGIVRDLLGTANRTVHPTSSGCWLRPRGRTGGPL